MLFEQLKQFPGAALPAARNREPNLAAAPDPPAKGAPSEACSCVQYSRRQSVPCRDLCTFGASFTGPQIFWQLEQRQLHLCAAQQEAERLQTDPASASSGQPKATPEWTVCAPHLQQDRPAQELVQMTSEIQNTQLKWHHCYSFQAHVSSLSPLSMLQAARGMDNHIPVHQHREQHGSSPSAPGTAPAGAPRVCSTTPAPRGRFSEQVYPSPADDECSEQKLQWKVPL